MASSQEEVREVGVVRSVLRSELTWVVFLVAGIWGFVTTVVLPLQQLQIQLTQIQVEITTGVDKDANLDTRVKALEIEHARITK